MMKSSAIVRHALAATAFLGLICVGNAQAIPEGYFALSPGVELVTGETWRTSDGTYRLYGIQSCLRGTTFTNGVGEQQDCGEASLAVFAAYIRDTAPLCAPVARLAASDLTYVSCYSVIGQDRLDLANILVAEGFAFAALQPDGNPVHLPYRVTEQTAQTARRGLWAFDDVQHPSLLVTQEWNRRNP